MLIEILNAILPNRCCIGRRHSAALASEAEFRAYLDGIKWWMIMAQAHDGGYAVMPGRDYASTEHVYGTRNFSAACAALILSLKEMRLQITGALRVLDQVKVKSGLKPSM